MQKELSEMSLEELWELFPIILTKHSDRWSEWYQEESKQLQTMLSEVDLIRISHIGSTAIHNIWAKPTVDILIEVRNKTDYESVYNALMEHGYACMFKKDTRMEFNKGYTKYGFAEKVFHIHVRFAGDHDELYFRDYLNDNHQIAKEYESLKLSLWKQYEHNRDGYTDAKTEFVRKYAKMAKDTYKDRYVESEKSS